MRRFALVFSQLVGVLMTIPALAAEPRVVDHCFGVRQNEKLPSSWTHLCVKWLRSQGLLKPSSDQ